MAKLKPVEERDPAVGRVMAGFDRLHGTAKAPAEGHTLIGLAGRKGVGKAAQGQPLPVLALWTLAKYAVRLEEAKAARTKALQDEYARLLYVALTRARDGLYVFGTDSKKGEEARRVVCNH